MSNQQANTDPLTTDRDNITEYVHETGTISNPVQRGDKSTNEKVDDDDYDSEEEWEDTPPAHLDHRGKQDRPNVGAAQNAADGGKKKPAK